MRAETLDTTDRAGRGMHGRGVPDDECSYVAGLLGRVAFLGLGFDPGAVFSDKVDGRASGSEGDQEFPRGRPTGFGRARKT